MALIVTGVHRSGTSMLAGILSNLGIPMGDGAQMNPAPENPEGFFERIDVMQLNDSVLKRLGGSWQAPPNLGPESWFSIDQNLLSHYRNSIDLFSGSFNSWFVKDPRISLILPIWDRLALTNLSLIFAVRNPQAVAQSLYLRDGLSHRRAIALWWAYNQQLLSSVDSRDTLFIDYDSAKKSKKATTEKIAAFALKAVKVSSLNTFDTNVGNYEEDRILDSLKTKKAELSINSRLSRSSSSKVIKGLAKSEIDETMEMYAVLKNLHGSTSTKFKKIRTPDWVFEELQSARVEFQLTQTIEKLHDQVETSKIEIATLNQLMQNAPQTEELKLAQSTLHTQSTELDRLQTHLITLEAERDSAQNQVQLLHNESEKQRKELDRLQTRLITLEAERDSAQNQALIESAKVRKLTSAVSAVSVELADTIAKLNRTFAELESAKKSLVNLQGELNQEKTFSQRLEKEFQNQIHEFVAVNNNNKNLEIELDSIKSSKGYRLISKYWKFKAKWRNAF